MANGDSFSIGGHPVAYNPARNSLFIGSRLGRLAEVSIPTAVNSANVEALPFASYLQGFYEPTEGHLSYISSTGVNIDGVLVYGSRLYGTASLFYDANNVQRVSHYSRSQQLNQASFAGFSQVWETEKTGFVSGFMALVPAEWQTALGGPAITGQCCIPIAWRTSWGPSAFAFDPTHVGQSAVDATPLLYYPHDHPTLGHWSGSNSVYGATAQVSGVALLAGTRTILYFGRNGLGPYCYGNGTSNQSLHGTMGVDGAMWCYDPTSVDKGQHAYPYRYQIWAYDLNHFADVKAGRKQPWDVVPYGVWPFDLPTAEPGVKIGGVGYDSATQTIYLAQMRADKDVYSNRPVIHVLKVGGVSGSPLPVPSNDPPPPPPTDPPPTTSTPAKLTSASITASKASPQPPGAPITLTAVPVGGAAPQQYKWQMHDGIRWNAIGTWSTSSTHNWTPSTAKDYRFSVWVRSAGNTKDVAEVTANLNFTISGTATSPTPAKVTSVGLSANKVAPQATSTTITFSAMPSGGTSPFQYKWRVFNGSSWTSGSWTTTSSYNWTPSTANSSYRVEVWARSAGNSADQAEALASMGFPITAPATAPPPPPPSTTKVSSVSITASKASPQLPGTTIAMTAVPLGGVAPHQYKWQIHDGVRWNAVGTWTTSNTYNWTPTTANAAYKLSVWVRSAGNTTDAAEALTNISFPISSTAPPSTAPPPTTSEPPPTTTTPPPSQTATVSSVGITASKASPQPPGTTIAMTAVPLGGIAPHQYKWQIHDGVRWNAIGTWTTANTYNWTPTTASSAYKLSVWVRSAGKTTDAAEALTNISFPISSTAPPSTAPPPTTQPLVSSVTLTANKASPQTRGTAITWTAVPSGGVAPQQYKFYVWDSAGWVVARGWSSSNTFTWVPNLANPYYKVKVWVRGATNQSDNYETSTESGLFQIK